MQHLRPVTLRFLTCLLVSGFLLTLGCGKNPAGPTNLVAFETIPGCSGGGSVELFQGKVLDQPTWGALWNKYCVGITTLPPVPTIDFSKEMVIALLLGTLTSSCHRVEIRKIEDVENKYVVYAVETVPPVCIPNVMWPNHLVKTARRDVPVEFILTQEVTQPR